MKILKFFLVLLILNACAGSKFTKNNTSYIGEWNGIDNWNNKGDIKLNSNGYASLSINGENLGGDNFIVEGIPSELKYVIDYNKKPVWIDFILYEKGNNIEQGRLRGIVEFIDDKKIRLLLNSNEERYLNFDKSLDKHIITLTKKQ